MTEAKRPSPFTVLDQDVLYSSTARMVARSRNNTALRPLCLRLNTVKGLSLDKSMLHLGVRDIEDNRSFFHVNPSRTKSTGFKAPPPARDHMVVHQPAELLACGSNVTVIDLLASGKVSDFLLGDWIDHRGRVTRVVIQVARPLVTESRAEASQVERLFLQENNMYHTELKHLQGHIVPKCFGLWVGFVPDENDLGGNTYTKTKDRLLLLITEFVPDSYDESVDKTELIQLPTPEHSSPPELPSGLQECYHAISGVNINHNAHQCKHWRCDSLGRWRVLDFTKASRQEVLVENVEDMALLAPRQRSTKPAKAVHFQVDDKNEKEP